MRYFVLLIAIALFTSCGLSPQEQLIADHVQQFQGSKLDLKFKPLKLELAKTVYGRDSAEWVLNKSKKNWPEWELEAAPTEARKRFERLNKENDSIKAVIKSIDVIKDFELYSKATSYQMEVSGKLNSAKVDTFSTVVMLNRYKHFSTNADAVLEKHYKCTYKIFNPLLQTEQEITKTFVFNADETVILNSY